ncbi:uncharacterized protein [Neodiprion pinetum]|uniref:uncharacterized protein n=1 Tax=Neodiprion pinetum TaxID=441929 RepID=UPI0037245C71
MQRDIDIFQARLDSSPDHATVSAVPVAFAPAVSVVTKMRTYKRKTERGTTSLELMQKAAETVIKEGCKVKTVAKEFQICHMTLSRFVRKLKAGEKATVGYKPVRLVFDEQQEKSLSDYLLKCSSIFFGLQPQEVRKLAYECALKFDVKNIPSTWHKNGMSGPDWLSAFSKRNPKLSIRAPEATSLSRATSFNKTNIDNFFHKLGDTVLKYNLPPSRIWNLDKTGVTTVQNPKKIIAQKGIKQVGAVVSAERGTLVTVEMAVSASGNTIPPMFVFPRLKFKDIFIRDGPPESIGAGNSSGWMTATEFMIYMDHFVKHVKPTLSEPVLLLLDNHCSHIDINVVEKAKANGVIMLSFPPHCTHRLQPLDVGVYGPFKSYCATAQDNWMRNNPAATPNNIVNAFKKTGICPLNKNIFKDEDFAQCYVTDRPLIESRELPNSTHRTVEENEPQPGPSNVHNAGQSSLTEVVEHPIVDLHGKKTVDNTVIFSPEAVRPLPKAPPRQGNSKRRIRKSAVLTDTPEKNALAEEQSKKRKKENENSQNKINGKGKGKGEGLEKRKVQGKGKAQAKRKVLQKNTESDNEEDSLEYYCIVCCDAYSKSQSGETWIQCLLCKNWAHSKCIKNMSKASYVCPNCDSDESCDDFL